MSQENLIKMSCSVCKNLNYRSTKNKKNNRRLEKNKHCKHCKKTTLHKETK